jgi:Tfp pilus assembly protein PilN
VKAVNLIPFDQRRGAGGIAGRSGGIVYVVVGGLAVVVALGVVYAFAVKSVADRKGQLATVTAQANAVSAQAASLQPYVAVQQLSNGAVSSTVTLAQSRFDWPDAMRQLALALPRDVTLTALKGGVTAPAAPVPTAPVPTAPTTTSTAAAPAAPATTTPTAGGSAGFSLSGCASSQAEVATVLRQLGQVPGVTGVQLATASKQGKAAPNAGKPVARRKAEARAGQCPLVSFDLTLSYEPTYTLPNQTLSSSGSKTAASGHGSVRATTRQPSR